MHCCGIESKSDFNGTTKWNRTNPWWNSSWPDDQKTFTYPLTCCPIDSHKQNWNDLPVKELEQATACAARGTGIYDVVSLLIINKTLFKL